MDDKSCNQKRRGRKPARGFTPEQAEVYALMIEGKSNVEIASILGKNIHTVKYHVRNILWKKGNGSRVKMIVAALQNHDDSDTKIPKLPTGLVK